jgi:uncharacterized membrane protein
VIKVEWLYWLIGLVFVVMAIQMATDRSNPKRWTSAAFWGLLGLTFPYGTGVANATAGNGGWTLPAEPLGVAVLTLIVLAGFNFLGKGVPVTTTGEQREASAARLGSKIFIPALTIPLVAIVCASVLDESGLFESGKATLLGLGLGCVAALVVGMLITGEKKVTVPLHSGRWRRWAPPCCCPSSWPCSARSSPPRAWATRSERSSTTSCRRTPSTSR